MRYSPWYSHGRKLPTALVCVGTLWSYAVTVVAIPSNHPAPWLTTSVSSSFTIVHRRRNPCAMSLLRRFRGGGGGNGETGSSSQPNRFEDLNAPNEASQNYYENYEGYNQRSPMYDDPQQHQQQQQQMNDYAPSFDNLPYDTTTEDPFPPETVQQRVERWKAEQREQGLLTSQNIPNSGHESVVSLLSSVSKGGRCMLFFVLMWRDIHLFEVADLSIGKDGKGVGGALRAMLVTPLVFLFVANLVGALVSLSSKSSTSATKRRLKAILKADMLVELILLLFYTIRLTIAPSKYISREVYVANIFHSIIFGLQCHAFTRVSWDDRQQGPSDFGKQREDNDPRYTTTETPVFQEEVAGMDSPQYYPSQHEEDTRQYYSQTQYDNLR